VAALRVETMQHPLDRRASPIGPGNARKAARPHRFAIRADNRLNFCSLYVLLVDMKDHPASWRMPTPKQMDKLAIEAIRRKPAADSAGMDAADMPPEYGKAVLSDPCADARPIGVPIQQRRLSEIPRHVLRVSCRRCDRVVEIQTADAVRLYGRHTTWKEAGTRLLDDGCRQLTGSREDDGSWPNFEP
jgi:hypothetical protein